MNVQPLLAFLLHPFSSLILHSILIFLPALPQFYCTQLFKSLDRDGDGEVSVEDFETAMDSVGAYVHDHLNYFVLLTLLQLI